MARTKAASAPATVTLCRHYWEIQFEEGGTSPGRCRYCGEVKRFKNTIEVIDTW